MNLTQLAQSKNVKLTQPQMNLLAKLDSYGVVISDQVPDTLPTLNPITGYTAELPALVSCLVRLTYQLIQSYERSPNYQMTFNGHKVAIQTYDRVKALILTLDNRAYQNFID
jgi:hypothetical protein